MVVWFSVRRLLLCLGAIAALLVVVQTLSVSTWDMSGLWTGDNRGRDQHGGDQTGSDLIDNSCSNIKYTTVTGFFLQDEASTNADGFDYSTTNFGLIDRAYPTDDALADAASKKTQWERFAHYVDSLNAATATDASKVQYKVLIMGRHGEGYHNVAESFYGTPAWNCYWAQLDGNGTVTWADAHLTEAGTAQATKANHFWASQLADQKQPAPERYYASPLTRCLQTAALTFGGTLALPAAHPFVPTIKERLREDISTHTCDRRSSKTDIHDAFPSFVFEDGFAETDELWTGTTAETDDANDVRSKALLDDIFAHSGDSTWLSFTSHSGEITSILRVLGHRTFSLSTGQIIPVLVRAETLRNGAAAPTTTYAWEAEATCAAPPVTSISGEGCVCSTTSPVPASTTAKPADS